MEHFSICYLCSSCLPYTHTSADAEAWEVVLVSFASLCASALHKHNALHPRSQVDSYIDSLRRRSKVALRSTESDKFSAIVAQRTTPRSSAGSTPSSPFSARAAAASIAAAAAAGAAFNAGGSLRTPSAMLRADAAVVALPARAGPALGPTDDARQAVGTYMASLQARSASAGGRSAFGSLRSVSVVQTGSASGSALGGLARSQTTPQGEAHSVVSGYLASLKTLSVATNRQSVPGTNLTVPQLEPMTAEELVAAASASPFEAGATDGGTASAAAQEPPSASLRSPSRMLLTGTRPAITAAPQVNQEDLNEEQDPAEEPAAGDLSCKSLREDDAAAANFSVAAAAAVTAQATKEAPASSDADEPPVERRQPGPGCQPVRSYCRGRQHRQQVGQRQQVKQCQLRLQHWGPGAAHLPS